MGQSTVNINFRMDAELKSNLEKACQELESDSKAS
jgi:hypothetical protein